MQDNTYHSLCYTSRGALDGTRNRKTHSDSVIGINFRPAVHQVGYGCILHTQLNHSCPGEPFIYSLVQGKMEINVLFSVSRVWQVGQVPWAPLEGGRHSNGLFLTYAT